MLPFFALFLAHCRPIFSCSFRELSPKTTAIASRVQDLSRNRRSGGPPNASKRSILWNVQVVLEKKIKILWYEMPLLAIMPSTTKCAETRENYKEKWASMNAHLLLMSKLLFFYCFKYPGQYQNRNYPKECHSYLNCTGWQYSFLYFFQSSLWLFFCILSVSQQSCS